MNRFKYRLGLTRPLLLPLILYIGMLVFSTSWIGTEQDSKLIILITLLPMLPATFLAIGVIRVIRKLDELEQKILLESAAFSFIFIFLGMIGAGLLENAGISPPKPIVFSFVMVILLFIGKLVGNWKHK